MTVAEIIAVILASLGLIFMLISFFGIVSFPDFYTRLHAQGVGDTLGMLLILAAMILCFGFKIISLKLVLIFIITLFTNPLGTSILMQAVVYNKDVRDDSPDDESKETLE